MPKIFLFKQKSPLSALNLFSFHKPNFRLFPLFCSESNVSGFVVCFPFLFCFSLRCFFTPATRCQPMKTINTGS